MATIKDVAQRADVSVATVSNYLNHTKPVSKAVSARIKLAIDELQYTQNLTAKSLKSNVYSDIGVILPNINDSYYVQIFQGIEAAFQNSDYYLNLAFSYDIPELEQNIARSMLRKQVCGLILVSCQPDAWKFYHENFARHNRPIVQIDRAIKSLDASFLSFDNRAALCRMTGRLLGENRSKLVLMSGPEAYTCEAECVRGFLDAHAQAGRSPSDSALVQTGLNKEDAFRKTTALLKKMVPDAILATSELTATGIIEGLRVLGYAPEDVPVVTLGEEHWNRYTHSFAAKSTARPAMKMGGSAANLLMEKLKSPMTQESERVVIPDNVPGEPPHEAAAVRRTGRPPDGLRILMLDTPPVHTFRNLIRNFENRTGISVRITEQPHNSMYETILRSFGEDDPENRYDVYMYDIPWLPLLAGGGVLSDLSERVRTLDTDAFLPGCMRYFSRFRGNDYGVPFMYAPQILYYRKDLFDSAALRGGFEKQYGSGLRPPVTFKEFNAVAEYFTQRTDAIPYGISIPAAYPECLAPELYMRLRAYGSEIIGRDGRVCFDTPHTLRAYINFIRAIRFASPNYLEATDVSIVDDFLRGETAMLITYPAFLTDVLDLRKNSMIGSVGCSQIPGRSPVLGGWSLGVNSRSTRKEAAFEFLKWTCDAQMGNYFALLGGQSAITSTYTNDELVKLYPWLPLYQAAYASAGPMLPPVTADGRVVPPNDVDAIVCKWAYRMIREDCEVEDIVARTQQELERLIAQRNEVRTNDGI